MKLQEVDRSRIEGAWRGRISGCQLGKPVELISLVSGREALVSYLERAAALPLRDYVPFLEDPLVRRVGLGSCKGHMTRSEPDDDINYTVIALLLLEQHGMKLQTADVARAWLKLLPGGATYTAERAAYTKLLELAHYEFTDGDAPRFDLAVCSDNEWNAWIGAQIRTDLYGWVCPGDPARAAELARRDASLSHRDEGVHGAVFVASLGAAIPACADLGSAVDAALRALPADSGAAAAVAFGRSLVGTTDAVARLHARYADMSAVHTLNNLALVVWALLTGEADYGQAVGEAVAAGWDTDCNGATVGGLWGLTGKEIPVRWSHPWADRVAVSLAGFGELSLAELVERTVRVAGAMRTQA